MNVKNGRNISYARRRRRRATLIILYPFKCVFVRTSLYRPRWCSKMPFESVAAFAFMFSCIDGSTNRKRVRARATQTTGWLAGWLCSCAPNAPAQCALCTRPIFLLQFLSMLTHSLSLICLWRFVLFVLDLFLSYRSCFNSDSSTVFLFFLILLFTHFKWLIKIFRCCHFVCLSTFVSALHLDYKWFMFLIIRVCVCERVCVCMSKVVPYFRCTCNLA